MTVLKMDEIINVLAVLHVTKPQNVSRNRELCVHELAVARKHSFEYQLWVYIYIYEWWNYEVLFQLSSESSRLDGLSECCLKILYWNSHLDTAKYRDTTLEKILQLSIERVSTTVSYEYQRVNGIIYLTINYVLRGSNDTRIILWNGSNMWQKVNEDTQCACINDPCHFFNVV